MLARAPLVGFNHNICYKGRQYHIQTEDLGIGKSCIHSSLFLNGMVVFSLRSDYEHPTSGPTPQTQVRQQMKEQHCRLMKQLNGGHFDRKIMDLMGGVEALLDPGRGQPHDDTLPMRPPSKGQGKCSSTANKDPLANKSRTSATMKLPAEISQLMRQTNVTPIRTPIPQLAKVQGQQVISIKAYLEEQHSAQVSGRTPPSETKGEQAAATAAPSHCKNSSAEAVIENSPQTLFSTGLMALRQGNYAVAKKAWEQAAALDPRSKVYQENLKLLDTFITAVQHRPQLVRKKEKPEEPSPPPRAKTATSPFLEKVMARVGGKTEVP